MKQITVIFGAAGYDSKVLGENGEELESVRQVEVSTGADDITTAKVTFMFPKVEQTEKTQDSKSVAVVGSRYTQLPTN